MARRQDEGDRPLPPWMPGAQHSGPPGEFKPQPVTRKSSSDPGARGDGSVADPPGDFDTTARRTRRTADASSIATLALGLPWFLYSLAVLTVFAGLFVRGTMLGAVYMVWVISGVLAFVPATEELIARVVLRARPPTENERAVLEPLWQDVLSTADVDGVRYRLWVQDRDGLNASASAGHIVIVTRRAIDAMPAHQLSSVLAHELGHHIGGHSWSQFLTYWYSLPSRLFTSFALWLVPWLIRGVLALIAFTRRLSLGFLARRFSIVGLVLFLVRVAILLFVGFVVLSAIGAIVAVVSPPIGAVVVVSAIALVLLPSWLARQGELRADRFAAEIGYGDSLVETLEDWLSMGVHATRHRTRTRLFSTHPDLSVRIDRLNTHLRRAGR